MGREDGQEPAGPRDAGRNGAGGTAGESPQEERARRFLDLWERNLSYLALNGPANGMPPGR